MAAPVASWSFDAGSGTTIAGDEGTSATLTVGAGGSFTASGHTGAAFQNTNSSATTGATGTVPAVAGTTCSLMAWVNPISLAANTTQLIAGSLDSGGTDFALWSQRGDFGTHNVLQGNARLGGGVVFIVGPALTVGTWSHVALTYDGTTLKLWLNGAVVASSAITNTISNRTAFAVAGLSAGGYLGQNMVDDLRYFATDESADMSTWMATPVPGAAAVDTSAFFAFF